MTLIERLRELSFGPDDIMWKAADSLARLEARVESLEIALKPFAEAWNWAVSDGKGEKLTIANLGHLAAGQLSGAHYQKAARSINPPGATP